MNQLPRHIQALGRLPVGQENKTEKSYGLHLQLRKMQGDILWFKFEGMKFRLADKTFYTPDFAVMRKDGLIELHEVKGYMQDDANVKIKCAAELYPFQFIIVRKSGQIWSMNPVPNRVQSTLEAAGA